MICIAEYVMIVQGHPRSVIFVSIEIASGLYVRLPVSDQ